MADLPFPRAAGVLLHPTSLPGPHGMGDLGGVPAFLSTHPPSEERFAAIEAAVKLLPEAARRAKPLELDYASIKAALPKK